MITRNRTTTALALAAVAIASLFYTSSSADAAVVVDGSKIVSGSATGTLVAIDVPFVTVSPTFGGPNWTADADDGFVAPVAANDGIREPMNGTSPWEPDGTLLSEAQGYFTYGNGPAPSVTWNFNLADSGIDIPDGAIINAVYATWLTRNVDGITYEYTEGAASDSVVKQTGGAAPVGDLVLSWDDSLATTRNGNFERIFGTPITVEGGDGFQLWGTDNVGNAAHIDAVVLDVTLPSAIPEPASSALAAFGLLSLGFVGWRRRRR
jgi:hypothetical protein